MLLSVALEKCSKLYSFLCANKATTQRPTNKWINHAFSSLSPPFHSLWQDLSPLRSHGPPPRLLCIHKTFFNILIWLFLNYTANWCCIRYTVMLFRVGQSSVWNHTASCTPTGRRWRILQLTHIQRPSMSTGHATEDTAVTIVGPASSL